MIWKIKKIKRIQIFGIAYFGAVYFFLKIFWHRIKKKVHESKRKTNTVKISAHMTCISLAGAVLQLYDRWLICDINFKSYKWKLQLILLKIKYESCKYVYSKLKKINAFYRCKYFIKESRNPHFWKKISRMYLFLHMFVD